jgi:UPF0755 protein
MDFKKENEENEEKKDNSEFEKNTEQPLEENIIKNEIEHVQQAESVPEAESVLPAEQVEFVKPRKNFNLELPLVIEDDELQQGGTKSEQQLEAPEEENEQPEKRGCLKALVSTTIIICISILLALTFISVINDMVGFYKPEKKIDVIIPQGADTAKITQILKNDKVITNDWAFSIYVKLYKIKGIQYGTFTLNSDMGYSDIIKVLKNAANNKAMVAVTFPEGYTIRQIAQTLEDKKICKMSDFLDVIENGNLKFKYSSIIPANKDRYYKLEGYLFPDTYNFYIDEAPTLVATTMLNNFSSKIDSTMLQKANQMNMTLDEVITLASIIQAEASITTEMGKVSSVFHNRLEKGIDGRKYLESDATIYYITRSLKPVLTQSDTEVKTAYNTYKHEGLPPGAINNPGLAAINAALSHESTNFFFFVTDSNNKYYYSATFAEHKKAVIKATKTGTAKGTNTITN